MAPKKKLHRRPATNRSMEFLDAMYKDMIDLNNEKKARLELEIHRMERALEIVEEQYKEDPKEVPYFGAQVMSILQDFEDQKLIMYESNDYPGLISAIKLTLKILESKQDQVNKKWHYKDGDAEIQDLKCKINDAPCPNHYHSEFCSLVKKDANDSKWIELRCYKCGGNGSVRGKYGKEWNFTKGAKGFAEHLRRVHHIGPDTQKYKRTGWSWVIDKCGMGEHDLRNDKLPKIPQLAYPGEGKSKKNGKGEEDSEQDDEDEEEL